jgi:hypothetical protein
MRAAALAWGQVGALTVAEKVLSDRTRQVVGDGGGASTFPWMGNRDLLRTDDADAQPTYQTLSSGRPPAWTGVTPA